MGSHFFSQWQYCFSGSFYCTQAQISIKPEKYLAFGILERILAKTQHSTYKFILAITTRNRILQGKLDTIKSSRSKWKEKRQGEQHPSICSTDKRYFKFKKKQPHHMIRIKLTQPSESMDGISSWAPKSDEHFWKFWLLWIFFVFFSLKKISHLLFLVLPNHLYISLGVFTLL